MKLPKISLQVVIREFFNTIGSRAAEAVKSTAEQFWSIFVRIKPKILGAGQGARLARSEILTFKNNIINRKIESHPLRQIFSNTLKFPETLAFAAWGCISLLQNLLQMGRR